MKVRNLAPIVERANTAVGEAQRWLRSGDYNKVDFLEGSANSERSSISESLGLKSRGLNRDIDSADERIEKRQNREFDSSALQEILPVLLTSILQLFTTLIGQLTGQSSGKSGLSGIGGSSKVLPNAGLSTQQSQTSSRIDTDSSGLQLQSGTLNGEPFVATPFFEVGETPEGFPFNSNGLSSFDTLF